MGRLLPAAWAGLLIGLLTWALWAPGQLALRDMLVLDAPALSAAALGFGDLPARNVPQDGLLALLGTVVPASWVARLLILGGAVAGAVGATWLTRQARGSGWAVAAAMTVVLWNPFVVERLLQGHWSLVIGAWLLPLIAAAGLAGRTWLVWAGMWVASLTPTGALFALLTGVAVSRGRRITTLLFGLLTCLPWLIPGLLAADRAVAAPASVAAFAPRAEAAVATPGALLGLGGIWNAEAVPASREAGFALFGVVLLVVLLSAVRRCPPVLLGLGALGLGGALLAWLLPGVLGWVVATVPGTGLLRDSQKLVMLALPAYAALAGRLRADWLAGLAVALALLQVPDAPRALAQLAPVEVAVDTELVALADGRDVLFIDRTLLGTRDDGAVILDPHLKALSAVESGALSVDGQLVDPPSPRWSAAREAWFRGDVGELAELGVGVVVDGDRVVETGAPARTPGTGLVLLAGWLLLPVVPVAAAVATSTGVRWRRDTT